MGTLSQGFVSTGGGGIGNPYGGGGGHSGGAPDAQGAAGSGAGKLASGSGWDGATMGGLTGGLVATGSTPASSSEPPCSTVADMVTAEPANNAPRVRAVNFHEPGDADE